MAVVTESFLPQLNGVTNSVLRVLETLKQKEIEAIVIAPTASGSFAMGFPVYTTASVPLLQFAIGVPGPAVSRILDQFQPDVIHVAAPFLLGAQAIGWGVKNEVPTVAVYQTDVAGYLERYNLAFARPVMERLLVSIHQGASLTLAPTPSSTSYLEQVGVPRVMTWGRGIDLDLFNPDNFQLNTAIELRKRFSSKPVVGFVGRLAPEKQVHRMRELFRLDAEFLVVGDGPERSRLEALFAGRAHFTGALSGLELAGAYAAIDVFVHFGTEETFGQTIQEAKASGLAVVAPACGGPVHLIQSGFDGLLVDPDLENSYLQSVQLLLDNPSLRSELGRNAVAAMAGKSWHANNAQLLEHYERVMLGQAVELSGELA